MPKMKSHSGAKKRFKKTSKGKWTYKKSGLRHLMTGMPSSTGRSKRRRAVLAKAEGQKINIFLPYD
ncbi:MAG: 50S ribosomal protein L35 [Elusimicrobia bacterium]|nr:50S ribosomal protein L35 [Elusimicrobiota bacterium]